MSKKDWLVRNFRAIIVLNFVVLLDAYWFGLTVDTLDPKHVDLVITILKIAGGGYVITGVVNSFLDSYASNIRKK